ncbi:MAG: hypothetical protein HY704_12490 [Gemmatimonadetes bacterium]|nr:hypothetical protein [Gemmatimonadota bacterium]
MKRDPSSVVETLLRAAGIACQVRPAGHDGSIAALRLLPSEWCVVPEAVRDSLVRSIKRAGFRYVALELTPGAVREGSSG